MPSVPGGRDRVCPTIGIVFGLLFLIGCGDGRPKRVPVTGVVTLNGKPVEDAGVMFMSSNGGRPASGVTDADGRFKLTTFKQYDGAVLGQHVITVTKKKKNYKKVALPQEGGGSKGGLSGPGIILQRKVVWLLPKEYSSPKTSGLAATVESGMDPVNLELTEN